MDIQYSVYLFSATVREFHEAISPSPGWSKRYSVQQSDAEIEVWVKPNSERDPAWKAMLEPYIDLTDLKSNRSSSLVILVRCSGRVFAVCFGYGHHLLNEYLLERNFGLLIAANYLDHDRIRGVGTRTLERYPVHTRSRRSKPRQLTALLQPSMTTQLTFIDLETDGSLPLKRVRGSKSLIEQTPFDLSELPNLLREHLTAYQRTPSRPHVSMLGLLPIIPRSSRLGQDCENTLLAALNEDSCDSLELVLPSDVGAEDDIVSFTVEFRERQAAMLELTWEQIRLVFDDKSFTTSEYLREAQIRALGHDGAILHSFALSTALVFEIERAHELIAYIEGAWYLYPQNHVEWINAQVESIESQSWTIAVPGWQHGWSEQAYNQFTAALKSWPCLDRVIWDDAGNRSRFELCDLLTDSGAFVHVKKYSGSQSISYLASQAVVSAESFYARPEVRRRVANIEVEHFGSAIHSMEREVVLAIAIEDSGPLSETLPIFAKLRLIQAFSELRNLGMNPVIATIRLGRLGQEHPDGSPTKLIQVKSVQYLHQPHEVFNQASRHGSPFPLPVTTTARDDHWPPRSH